MSKRKQLLLFVVEGGFDIKALRPILDHGAFPGFDVEFIPTGGDIFNKDEQRKIALSAEMRLSLLETKIVGFITSWLNNKGRAYKASDIAEVIQIVDTDAVFIGENRIVEDASVPRENDVNVFYDVKSGCIFVKNKEFHIGQRKERSHSLAHFSSLKKIDLGDGATSHFVPYRVLYMSCNLEHVMHNTTNIPKYKEKTEKDYLAGQLARRYGNNLASFVDFICKSDFSVPGNYEETWLFIMDEDYPARSLERYTNFGVLFE